VAEIARIVVREPVDERRHRRRPVGIVLDQVADDDGCRVRSQVASAGRDGLVDILEGHRVVRRRNAAPEITDRSGVYVDLVA